MFFVSVLAVLYPVQTHPQCVKRYFDKEDISLMTICPWHATNVSENPEMQRIQSYVNSMCYVCSLSPVRRPCVAVFTASL